MRLGIDIGGTKTDAVAVDDLGRLRERVRLTTGFGSAAVIATAVEAVAQIAHLTGLGTLGFESIGVGVPGVVDSRSGRVQHAVNLGFEGLDLGDELTRRLGVAVRVENDVNAASLGAYQLLSGVGTMAYLNLGTGMAAGIVVDGALWRGATGIAGEIGHIPVDPLGAPCLCGQRGCLETVASGTAIARLWPTEDPHPARSLFAAAATGDREAAAVVGTFAAGIASAVRILVLTADVESVVIGGGLSHLGEPLLTDVRAVLTRWSASSSFVASLALPDRIRLVPDGFPAAAVGAALVGVTPHG